MIDRIALAALLLAGPLASEEALRVAVSSASADGFRVEVATSLPANACVTLSLWFEDALAQGAQAAVYVGTDGRAAKTIGPFPGRSVLRGVYGVRADVDPTNQDPGVQGWFRANPGPFAARAEVRVGTPEGAEEDRKAFVKYLTALVEDCRGKQKELRALYDDLISGKQFRKSGAREGLDTVAWDGAIRAALLWQERRNEEHQQFIARVVAPCFPDLVQYTAFNFLGGLGLLGREYASRGYAHYKMKPPSQYAIKALIKPDLAVMEMMFERDARSLLQGIGKLAARSLSEVTLSAGQVPAGLRLGAVPEALSEAVSENPATLSAEETKRVADWNAVAPGLDLTGAKEVFWMRVETAAEPKAEAEVWTVAYESAQRRADAVAKLAALIPKDSIDRAFGGEQFLCWVRITGPMPEDVYTRLLALCHDRLGW